MKPQISVVMSVYNGATYLEAAMNSIINQTFTDFEFIIIDDCSTDNSYEILHRFSLSDNRIRLYKSEKNIGVAGFIKNLNSGIEIANGEFIARMDQDDLSDITRFQKQVDFLKKNPDIDFIGTSVILIDENGNNIGNLQAPLTDNEIKKMMPKRIALHHPVLMFRNKGYRYREKMLYCEDYDLYFTAITSGAKFANLPEPLLQYRILRNSMSRKNTFVRNLFVEQCINFYYERKKYGNDSYANFAPEQFLNILSNDANSDTQTTVLALRTALKFDDLKEFKLIIKKAKEKQQSYRMLEIIQLVPPKIRRAIFKFL